MERDGGWGIIRRRGGGVHHHLIAEDHSCREGRGEGVGEKFRPKGRILRSKPVSGGSPKNLKRRLSGKTGGGVGGGGKGGVGGDIDRVASRTNPQFGARCCRILG